MEEVVTCGLQERVLKVCLRMTRNTEKVFIITPQLGRFTDKFGRMDTW